jgi:hypothetical protein
VPRERQHRFGFAAFAFKCGKICFPRLTLANKEGRRFGKRPAQMHVADPFARRTQPFANLRQIVLTIGIVEVG